MTVVGKHLKEKGHTKHQHPIQGEVPTEEKRPFSSSVATALNQDDRYILSHIYHPIIISCDFPVRLGESHEIAGRQRRNWVRTSLRY